MTLKDERYGHGRKPEQARLLDANLYELRRKLHGFLDEIVYPSEEGKAEVRVPVKLWMPQVESAAWADEIADAARSGRIPYSTGWRKLRFDASVSGVYPPWGNVLETNKKGQVTLYRVRGKTRCRECGIPSSPIYQNVYGVCFDCQLAELPGIGGGAPALYRVQIRKARRSWRHEATDEPVERPVDLGLLNLTPDQYEIALMYVQGFTLDRIAEMTNRSQNRINTVIQRIRKRCRALGLRELDRDEDRSGNSRHVRTVPPDYFRNIG